MTHLARLQARVELETPDLHLFVAAVEKRSEMWE